MSECPPLAPRCARRAGPHALLLAVTLAASQAAAQQTAPDAATVAEARYHYARGAESFRAGRFAEAIEEFDAAYALGPHPTVLYSLAQAHERLRHVPDAIRYYERYLADAPPDAPHRAEVNETLRSLRALLAELEVDCDGAARVLVDGVDVGAAPGVFRVAAGTHEVELRAEGRAPERRTATLTAGARETLRFLGPSRGEGAGLHPMWFWGSVGLAGVGAVATVTLGVLTVRAATAYAADPARTSAMRDDGQQLAVGTDVALALTAGFGVAAVVLGLRTAWSPSPAARVSLAPTPGGVGLAGTF